MPGSTASEPMSLTIKVLPNLPKEGIVFRNSIGTLSIRSMLNYLKTNISNRQLFIGRVILILNGCGLILLHINRDLPFFSENDKRASLCRNYIPVPVVFSLSKAVFVHSGNMKSIIEMRGKQKSHELMRWDVKPKRGDKVSFNIIKQYPDNYNNKYYQNKCYGNPVASSIDKCLSPPSVLLATNISVVEFGSDRILELCTESDSNYDDDSRAGSVSTARDLFSSNPELAVKPTSFLEAQKKYIGIVYSVRENEGEFGFIKCVCRLDESDVCTDKLQDNSMYEGIANGLEVFFRKEHFISPLSLDASGGGSSPKQSSVLSTGGGCGYKIKVGSVVVFKGAWVKDRPQAHNIQLLLIGDRPLSINDFMITGEICLKYDTMVVAAAKELRVSGSMAECFAQSIDIHIKTLMVQLMKELYYIIGPTQKLEVGDAVAFVPNVDVSTHVQGLLRDRKGLEDTLVLCSKVSAL